ncbi:Crp/Fnr family transcriptional regulator [Gracilimonas mengyeensis]|uniref:CRP/FNR family transcriptional regulator, anaerobic regulatory protein n=1 Tax=Gracilimonas mengyeensis TaxID=1302730 RepID=A0A521DVB7_9BACT|nr:Crp/Fnr family transcriptional regulator [Gracilimonas mengyeensis]SMO75636.1 CRP/FNR family transcriptional regulator, anaerobic regulatory protein [Gracilimonas mengyeensis]
MKPNIPSTEVLKKNGIIKIFETGDVIVNEDAPVQSIPFVIRGSLKVMQSDDDYREMVMYYLQPGETCVMSFLAALYNDTSKVKAIAEEETEVVFVPINKIRELMGNDPEWLNYVFRIYHKRFEELLGVVNAIAFKKMDERLLQFLRKKAEVSGSNQINITHSQLGQELGTAREVVSRLLKQLESEEIVQLGRNRITLL